MSALRGVGSILGLAIVAGVGCSGRSVEQGDNSTSASTEPSSSSSTGTSTRDAGPTSGAVDTTGDGSTTTTTGSSSSTGDQDPFHCEQPPRDPDSSSFNICTIPGVCSPAYADTPEGCGINGIWDAEGCARFRCDGDEDCGPGELCQDLVACVAPVCVPWRQCDDSFGQCHCLSNESCETELKLCFLPEELDCTETGGA